MKCLTKTVLICATTLVACIGTANAAFISGSMGVTGNYDTGGDPLFSANAINLNTVKSTDDALGTLGTTVNKDTVGVVNNGSFNIDPFTSPQNDVFSIGGWQLDLTSLTVTLQLPNVLLMEGTGVLSGNGYDSTNAIWSFNAVSANSYSMTIESTVVPVPAAVWLFGSGLLGLIAIGGRKSA